VVDEAPGGAGAATAAVPRAPGRAADDSAPAPDHSVAAETGSSGTDSPESSGTRLRARLNGSALYARAGAAAGIRGTSRPLPGTAARGTGSPQPSGTRASARLNGTALYVRSGASSRVRRSSQPVPGTAFARLAISALRRTRGRGAGYPQPSGPRLSARLIRAARGARAAAVSGLHRISQPSPDTAAARLGISALSLGSLTLGAVGFLVDADIVRMPALLVFSLVGIGSAPWQINGLLRLPTRLALGALTSVAVLTLGSVVMLTAAAWHPVIAFVGIAAAALPLHVRALGRARRELQLRRGPPVRDGGRPGSPAGMRARFFRSLPVLVATLGGVLCLGSSLTHRHIDPGFFGFLPKIGPAWYVGLGLILAGLIWSRRDAGRMMGAAALLLVTALTLTPALVYDGPRSQVAAKHVDLVLQIQTLHHTDSALQVYNAWPGYFAFMAWLCDITGIGDPMTLATFWPVLLGLFRIVALRYIFGVVLRSPYQAWVGVALAVLADPIGADYFSPQSVGFVVGLITFALALSRDEAVLRRTMILVAGLVLAVSHQLSPYTVGGVLALLVVFRLVRPWWTPLLVLGPALFWALVNRGALAGLISLSSIGRSTNFRPPRTDEATGLDRLPVVNEASAALTVGIVVLAMLAFIALVRHIRDKRAWAFAFCPGMGLLLVALNPYGQEGIFRAALFGIPWLALLAAYGFSPPRTRVTGLVTRTIMFTIMVGLAGTFLVAAFGLDAVNVMRPSDLAAYRYFQNQGTDRARTPRYILALGAGDLPTSLSPKDGSYQSVRRDRLGDPVRPQPPGQADSEVQRLTTRLLEFSRQGPENARLYAVWSPVSSHYGQAYGLQTPEQFAELRDAFIRCPYWEVELHQGQTYLFRFEPIRYPGTAR
jgi:hypothetical protein